MTRSLRLISEVVPLSQCLGYIVQAIGLRYNTFRKDTPPGQRGHSRSVTYITQRVYRNDLFSLSVRSSSPWDHSGGPYFASRRLFSRARRKRITCPSTQQTAKHTVMPVKLWSYLGPNLLQTHTYVSKPENKHPTVGSHAEYSRVEQ